MQGSSRPASASNRPTGSPAPRVQYHVNTQTKVLDSAHGRILCIADIRGRLSALNDLARDVNAIAVIHTGDFGFFGLCIPLFFLRPFSPLTAAMKNPQAWRGSMTEPSVISQCTLHLFSQHSETISSPQKILLPVFGRLSTYPCYPSSLSCYQVR